MPTEPLSGVRHAGRPWHSRTTARTEAYRDSTRHLEVRVPHDPSQAPTRLLGTNDPAPQRLDVANCRADADRRRRFPARASRGASTRLVASTHSSWRPTGSAHRKERCGAPESSSAPRSTRWSALTRLPAHEETHRRGRHSPAIDAAKLRQRPHAAVCPKRCGRVQHRREAGGQNVSHPRSPSARARRQRPCRRPAGSPVPSIGPRSRCARKSHASSSRAGRRCLG